MRKNLLVVIVLILAATVLAACSPTAEKPAVSSSSTEAAVETQPTPSTEAVVETQSPASSATVVQSAAPILTINAEELTNQRCSECHPMSRVRNTAKTPEEWATTVKRMQGKGMKVTPEELNAIVAFLSENYKK